MARHAAAKDPERVRLGRLGALALHASVAWRGRSSARRYDPLVVLCPLCGEGNPDRARFCLNCAAPLGTQPAPRDVRKVVTVLFADVSGSTALGERLDPESLRAL